MRIAYILLWFPEPSQTFILDEVNTLTKLGLDLQVYTLYGPRSPRRLAGMAPALPPIHHLGLASTGKLLQNLIQSVGTRPAWPFLAQVLWRKWRSLETRGEAFWAGVAGIYLARLIQAEGIQHIHAPWANGPATAAWVASHLSGIPFSFGARAHDLHPPDGALLEKLAAAALVRTNTLANRQYLTELAPWAAAKIVNVYNGVLLPPPLSSRRISHSPYQFLTIGRLVYKKGFHILLESCRQLGEQGVDFTLTIAGEGPERRRLESLIEQYNLGDRVILPGRVPHAQITQYLQQADLFLMPCVIAPSGDRDGIPNVILEALLHGVPVVASRVSGIPEVIRPKETGWLALPEDATSLTHCIREALANPDEARCRAQQGRDLVREEFNSAKNYTRLKAQFEALSEPRPSKPSEQPISPSLG